MRLMAFFLIGLFLCSIPFEQSFADRRRPSQIEILQQGAFRNSAKLQFELGLAYYQGDIIPRDYVDAYIWFAIASSNGHSGAAEAAKDIANTLSRLGILKYAERKAQLYYKRYVTEKSQEKIDENDFIIYVNDIPYQYAAAITPSSPIRVRFSHPDPSVTTIRMQHPGDPSRSIEFKADQPQRVTNHEQHMSAGDVSSSLFIALDSVGKKKGSIIVSFVP